jgi:hypothetical protein
MFYHSGMNGRTSRRGNAGLIIVVLLALAIILYLMFGNMGGGKSYMGTVASTRKQAKQTVQDINTQQMSMLIAMYRQRNGKLPKSPADMDDDAQFFKDPWGGPLTFTFEESKGGRGGATRVVYHSNGPDGEAKTEDDVTKTDTLPPL